MTIVPHSIFQVQKLQESIDLQKAQKQGQSNQTQQVKNILNEASTELDVLRLERKQILQQWNASLVGMQRRDEALAGIQNVKHENQDQLNTMRTEMGSYKRSILQAQEKNELLTGEQKPLTLFNSKFEGPLFRVLSRRIVSIGVIIDIH